MVEKESVTSIHKSLQNVCCALVVDKHIVTLSSQIARSEKGKAECGDQYRSGHPTAPTQNMLLQRADEHIRNDWWITSRKLAINLLVSKGSVNKIIHALEYSTPTDWFPIFTWCASPYRRSWAKRTKGDSAAKVWPTVPKARWRSGGYTANCAFWTPGTLQEYVHSQATGNCYTAQDSWDKNKPQAIKHPR